MEQGGETPDLPSGCRNFWGLEFVGFRVQGSGFRVGFKGFCGFCQALQLRCCKQTIGIPPPPPPQASKGAHVHLSLRAHTVGP